MHKHPYWEIVFFLEGTGVHTIGEKDYRFCPNMAICQPPYINHGTIADDVYQDLYIIIKDFTPPTSIEIPIFMDDKENRFLKIALLMYTTYHRHEANYKEIVQALLNAMYQLLISWTERQPKNHYIDAAIHELVLNFSNPRFNTRTLAQKSNFCTDHFRRSFKKQTGTTPTAYLINLRIEHAKKLLAQKVKTNQPIKDIALLSGFSDPYYFSRLFKERTGVSPMHFI